MSGLTFRVQNDLILTISQFFVLDSLATTTIGNASDIAKSMLYDKGSMVRLLDGLEERHLITRCRVIGDRRRINIALTTLGKEAADSCKALYQSLCGRVFANVDLVELDRVLAVASLVDQRIAQSKSSYPLKSI
jgi:DNA-binding MarR family transcriptional regulator